MKAFTDKDIQNLLSIWRGKIKFKKNSKDNEIVQIQLHRKYTMTTHDKENITFILIRMINGYNFLKIEGSGSEINLTATVQPSSLSAFFDYCSTLKVLEQNNHVKPVAVA